MSEFKRDLLQPLKAKELEYRTAYELGRQAGYLEGKREILNEVQTALDALEAKRPAQQAG